MKSASLLAAFGILAFTAAFRPAFAHHGGAAFDQTTSITMQGTVTELRFTNPHVLIFFDVNDGQGETSQWSGWLTAPNKLARAGWTKRTLEPGDQVSITGRPHKDGNHVVQIQALIGPDEQSLPTREFD